MFTVSMGLWWAMFAVGRGLWWAMFVVGRGSVGADSGLSLLLVGWCWTMFTIGGVVLVVGHCHCHWWGGAGLLLVFVGWCWAWVLIADAGGGDGPLSWWVVDWWLPLL